MSEAYQWIAHQQVVEYFVRLKSSDRHFLLDHFEHLALDPFQQGDVAVPDEQGREMQIKICGRFIVTYWADHAVKEIRIVSLEIS